MNKDFFCLNVAAKQSLLLNKMSVITKLMHMGFFWVMSDTENSIACSKLDENIY